MRRGSAIAIVCALTLLLGLGGCSKGKADDPTSASRVGVAKINAQNPLDLGAVTADSLPQSLRPEGAPVSAQEVEQLWAEVAQAANEGQWTSWGSVIDATSGQVLLDASARQPHTPASTTKVLTAFTALSALDPSKTLSTSLTLAGSRVHLSSQGDLLLGEGSSQADSVKGRAGLADLAEHAASALTDAGLTSVSLTWSASPFSGTTVLPSWVKQDVANYEGPVAAMAIDAGRTAEGAYEFYADPAQRVAQVFGAALEERGIEVSLDGQIPPPEESTLIASVESATMGEQIRWMLAHSDNTLAEQYCRLAAKEKNLETSFSASTALIASTLKEAGVDTGGLSLEDCSGLSSNDTIAPATLTGAIAHALRSTGALADLPRDLPWAGASGTMRKRMAESQAYANAQAKTGSLAEVSSLAGIVETSNGRLLVFAVGNESVPGDAAALTRPILDTFVAGLAAL